MKGLLYPRLAIDGIRKNSRLVAPYMLTCAGMVMMRYILAFLVRSPATQSLPGGVFIATMLELGVGILTIFACIFLFYTNSFLMRRRKKEFGLYNVLGMGKVNLAQILFWETVFMALLSIAMGLAGGAAFAKLAELGLFYIMDTRPDYVLSVSWEAAGSTASAFAVIFVLLFVSSVFQISRTNAIDLLHSENAGEKPPRANVLIGLLGVILLGWAYYIAVTIVDPLSALLAFFFAVLLVIVGTYLLLIAGSVVFCRLLQKNKRYYYKANHFVSVSSMVFRMKRNGAGLASICILVTMVLVMMSATASLYIGGEDSLYTRYPRELNFSFYFVEAEQMADSNVDALRQAVDRTATAGGATVGNALGYRSAMISGMLVGDTVETDVRDWGLDALSTLYTYYFIPLADYNRITGQQLTLEPDEALLYVYRQSYTNDTIRFNGGKLTLHIKAEIPEFIENGEAAMNSVPTMMLIVPDLQAAVAGLDRLADFNGDRMINFRYLYGFDTGLDDTDQMALERTFWQHLEQWEPQARPLYTRGRLEGRASDREEFFAVYGGLFYLGILLSIVFLAAAVLIIYYKQISEGYEDQARFAIMQKVGMTRRAIRKSINSQLLTVFFLPLALAACHLAFAFPIVQKLLTLFNFNNQALFATTAVVCVLIFGAFYTVVYAATSNAYYHIVSGARQTE